MTKNNIIFAALRLFLLRGYKYVSLTDVAKEVGITKGGIYHYFTSKEDLLNAIIECLFDYIRTKITSLFREGRSLRETLYRIVVERAVEQDLDALVGVENPMHQMNIENFMFEVRNHFPHIHERLNRDFMETCDEISRSLQKGVHNGEIRADLDTDALATIIFTMIQGDKFTPVRFENQNDRERIVETICKMTGC